MFDLPNDRVGWTHWLGLNPALFVFGVLDILLGNAVPRTKSAHFSAVPKHLKQEHRNAHRPLVRVACSENNEPMPDTPVNAEVLDLLCPDATIFLTTRNDPISLRPRWLSCIVISCSFPDGFLISACQVSVSSNSFMVSDW